jgi:hypothetical protein
MYWGLNLAMPARSRLEQFEDFFFRHVQPRCPSEKVKEKILRIYALTAKSDPNRYGNPEEGKVIVENAQMALMVSCPYISDELTQAWGRHMQGLIDLQKSGQLKVSLKREMITKEARELIKPSNPDIPRCLPSAIPVLEQIARL